RACCWLSGVVSPPAVKAPSASGAGVTLDATCAGGCASSFGADLLRGACFAGGGGGSGCSCGGGRVAISVSGIGAGSSSIGASTPTGRADLSRFLCAHPVAAVSKRRQNAGVSHTRRHAAILPHPISCTCLKPTPYFPC